mmetsp:Transcript_52689/g.112941  ORF Transcript_52689/g.112941 Transcript_52689/m.112941 type:complete len:224 (-) Transcript_52689:1029-1700(-)
MGHRRQEGALKPRGAECSARSKKGVELGLPSPANPPRANQPRALPLAPARGQPAAPGPGPRKNRPSPPARLGRCDRLTPNAARLVAQHTAQGLALELPPEQALRGNSLGNPGCQILLGQLPGLAAAEQPAEKNPRLQGDSRLFLAPAPGSNRTPPTPRSPVTRGRRARRGRRKSRPSLPRKTRSPAQQHCPTRWRPQSRPRLAELPSACAPAAALFHPACVHL